VMVFMNLDSWEALSDEGRAAIERAAIRLERESVARFDVLAAEEKADLLELGMEMTSFSDAEAAEFEALWSNGVWSIAEKGAPEAVGGLRALAVGAGLSE
jgi:TRAP-type C4-dicarboxylate transport system, periplasmic component